MEKETFNEMLVEFNENNKRATNLRNLILDEEKMKEIDNLNKDLMIAQLKAMEAYISVLSIRTGLNAPKEEKSVSE